MAIRYEHLKFIKFLAIFLICLGTGVVYFSQKHRKANEAAAILARIQYKHLQLLECNRVSDELAAVRRNGVSFQLSSQDIDKMNEIELSHTMHSILDNTDTICNRKLRMGALGDGGWEICDDVDVRPRAPPCIVYSFGISGDFSFDDDTAGHYGCHVYAFDPSMKEKSYSRSALVHFYQIGISNITHTNDLGWDLYTFSDIRKMLGHDEAHIDVVKMDVENAEWGAVQNMIATGETRRIKQLLMEYHLLVVDEPAVRLAQSLEKEGFKKFYTHKNPVCIEEVANFPGKRTICYEVHYLRRSDDAYIRRDT